MDLNLSNIPARSEHELFIKNSCLKLLNDYGSDPKEHMFRLAKFVANEMSDDYKPVVFNGRVPELMAEYKSLGAKGKLEFNKKYPEWRTAPEVIAYNNEKGSTEMRNDSNKRFLKDCLKALEGTSEKAVIQRMLGEYQVTKEPVGQIDWHH